MTPPITRRQFGAGLARFAGHAALAGTVGVTRAADAPTADADAEANTDPARAFREFRAWRRVRGHFDGGAWNDAVDRWQGPKHRAMQQAAARLLAQHAGAGPLRRALGAPDAVLAPGSADHARAREGVAWIEATPAAAPQRADLETGALWLYRWRGTHDQLVFALVGGRVAAAGWVYAGE